MSGRRLPAAVRCAAVLLVLMLTSAASPAAAAVVTVADGVYVDVGAEGPITPDNLGQIANSALIVGRDRALALDSGISAAHGERLLAAWRDRTGGRPIDAVLLSRPAEEVVFGAVVFERAGIPVTMLAAGATLMQSRCNDCLSHLRERLPGGLMRGTRLIRPSRKLLQAEPIILGDRTLELIDGSAVTTPGTLAVFDAASGTLFAGGLVSSGRIPSLRDADVPGWIALLDTLRARGARRIVPGSGPIGGAERIADMQRYLRATREVVQSHYARGASLLETMAAAGVPAFAGWTDYATRHPQNVERLYRQFEDAELQ